MSVVDRIFPVKDWVLIEVFKEDEEIIRGIIIPKRGHKFTNYGKVLKVGPGRKNNKGIVLPMELKIGDVVYISNLGRCEFVKNDEDRTLILCAEPLIDGIVEEWKMGNKKSKANKKAKKSPAPVMASPKKKKSKKINN